jgi:hypothetical protein
MSQVIEVVISEEEVTEVIVATEERGPAGETGPAGDQGDPGDSAYDVAVENGFVGTEAEWITSLEGPTGPDGPQGDPGADGSDGAISGLQDEGVDLAVQPKINFTGAGVDVTDDAGNGRTNVAISGGSTATDAIWDAAGDLAKGTGADTAARLARGTANQVLKTNSGATDIEWGVEQIRDIITTAGDLVYGTAADTAARLGIGTAGQVLTVNSGATAPEWAAAAGGGIGDLLDVQYARKTANEIVNNSTTLQNDDHLTVAVGANQTWIIRYHVRVLSNAAADVKFGLSVPASTAGAFYGIGPATNTTGAATTDASMVWGNTIATALSFGATGSGDYTHIFLTATVRVAGTAGNVVLQFAQATANASDTTVGEDSVMIAERVA